ncbi:hypothetical protein M2352_001471 [Azospirillum fermentarium]|uniref:hypothetical protein n=1 Tax=Azospirillum fermentarium TaxID=1233114 RepID=UPI002226C588|nr:hypothetical protein [Azospirillum fermentarium]MCW2245880.1 hypothetical protein [Azospirillum fermentarium]
MHTETGEALPAPPSPAPLPPAGQSLLFDDLPETAPPAGRRRRGASPRRSAAAAVAVDQVHEPVPAAQTAPSLPPLFAAAPPPVDPLDPARLSLAEIRALVQALPDAKLAHLLTEAARELKQRVTPGGDWDDDGGVDGERDAEPNPLLLRAARQTVGELSGDDT